MVVLVNGPECFGYTPVPTSKGSSALQIRAVKKYFTDAFRSFARKLSQPRE